ncbi:hypothetical protein YTPLAS18_08280 [Nitrospira sp.]|nr:hypothetical protein YTPLAS18_08280 [Nitrospira sp.]
MWEIRLFALVGASQGILAVDGRFLEGYARALLDREYRLAGAIEADEAEIEFKSQRIYWRGRLRPVA